MPVSGRALRALSTITVLVLVAAPLAGLSMRVGRKAWNPRLAAPDVATQRARDRLYASVQPVALANCTLERFGEAHDGGYLFCGNLLPGAAAVYSYGISGYDGWGCGVATRLGVTVHEYDCFNQSAPACPTGTAVFHPECVADVASTDAAGRPFASVAQQIESNGNATDRVVVKMDVEGAEWTSLLATPDDVLGRIDQLVMEFHNYVGDAAIHNLVMERLLRHFVVAHLHFNNYACRTDMRPFPAGAYEVLLVNRRLAVLAPPGTSVHLRPHALDTPNQSLAPDCQSPPQGLLPLIPDGVTRAPSRVE